MRRIMRRMMRAFRRRRSSTSPAPCSALRTIFSLISSSIFSSSSSSSSSSSDESTTANKFALVIGSFPFSFLACPTMNPCRAFSTRATSFAFLNATNSNASKRSRILPKVVKMTFVSVLKDSMVAFVSHHHHRSSYYYSSFDPHPFLWTTISMIRCPPPLFIVFFSSSPNDVNDDDSNVDDGFIIIKFIIASVAVFSQISARFSPRRF